MTRKRSFGVWIGVLALALTVGGLGGCATNEATGESQFIYLNEAEEIELGEKAEPEFIRENGGEVPSPTILSYVSNLGHELAAVSERPDLPWEFHVLNTDVINAFALPGGKVFMTRGLLSRMNNEAQLAGVLGHEIGHVTARHINDRMVQQVGVTVAAAAIGVAGEVADEDWLRVLGVGTQVGGGVFLLKFSRDDESQSDELGVRYMTKLGYNPYGQVQVMQILKEAQGDGGGPEFFATHPMAQTRIDRLTKLIAEQYPRAGRAGEDTDAAGTNDLYRFGEASFQKNVLAELEKLPPPEAKSDAGQ